MGIKGKRKREQQRRMREEAEGSSSDDHQFAPEPFLVFGGGPFAPPVNDAPPKLSKSEAYRLRDEEYLEEIREAHKERRTSHLSKKRSRTDDHLRQMDDAEKNEQLLTRSDAPVAEADVQQLHDTVGGTKRKTIAVGARFDHSLLGLNPHVVEALSQEGFVRMTKIQERIVPLALDGYDLLGQAKTGSGKTLAFCVPALHHAIAALERGGGGGGGAHSKAKSSQTVALMVSPTKELCVQTFHILELLCGRLFAPCPRVTVQLTTGGTSIADERKRLSDGVHIVIGTPGRLCDHIKHCHNWTLQALKVLVFDEADKMLADGFRRDLDCITSATPKSRQTLLFSATNSKSVAELARFSLSKTPLFVDTKGDCPQFLNETLVGVPAPPYRTFETQPGADEDVTATAEHAASVSHPEGDQRDAEDIPSSLRQFCAVIPASDRLRALYVFVKRVAKTSKAMIFCSTVASTIFHCQMMGSIGFHDDVLMLHGHMKHRQRIATFEAFNQWDTGVLFCTDVAARGLDIPNVAWILQYDPPLDPTEYVHRIGRTARAGSVGQALVFLTPEETPFIRYLQHFGITMEQYPMPPELPKIQEKLEHVLQLDPIVAKSAVHAFRAHVGAYQSHLLKESFDAQRLDLPGLTKAFALTATPNVSLSKQQSAEDNNTTKKQEYVKGKLKSLNKRKAEALRHFEQLKTKPQWDGDGVFIGMAKPSSRVGSSGS